jgi:hypothetical protein
MLLEVELAWISLSCQTAKQVYTIEIVADLQRSPAAETLGCDNEIMIMMAKGRAPPFDIVWVAETPPAPY